MSSAITSTSPAVSEGSQHKSGRAVWTAAADYSFVHTLASHTVCNGATGLLLKHKYVDPSIIEFAEESLNKEEKLEDIAKLLESKFPNKRAEHRSVECLSLLVELRSKTPEFTFHQLNHKHINMWTRTIVPFRHLFDSGLLFKGKSIFHKDCKRFTKCIVDFLAFTVSKAANSGIENAFTRGPNQGNKLLEQWLGIMLSIHKSNMADFLYHEYECIGANSGMSTTIRNIRNDQELDAVKRSDDVLVDIQNASFKWLSTDEISTINNVSLQCKRSKLIAVIGRVGSGKSSLASAILGNMIKTSGDAIIRGSVAYVPQQPWIINATLRDNILFGHELDPDFYDRVIEACALKPDLEMLPTGDMTEIGEKGINLSGGQKARLSLARAVYARADIYVLDDPLAAVDAHVSKHLFTQVIGPSGLLASRARILVTNAVQYLPATDYVLMLNGGNVLEQGTPSRLLSSNGQVYEFVHKYIKNSSDSVVLQNSDLRTSVKIDYGRARRASATRAVVPETSSDSDSSGNVDDLETGQLIQNEANQHATYGILGLASSVVTSMRTLMIWTRCSIKASEKIHDNMLLGVMHSPMSYFDVTPMGRIINRFSSDMMTCDLTIPWAISAIFIVMFNIISSVAVIGISMPILLAAFVPIFFVYRHIQHMYSASSREISRIVSSTRSPVYSHIQETISGAASIRAFAHQQRYVADNELFMENNVQASYINYCTKRWLALRIEWLGDLILLCVTLFAVGILHYCGHGDAGLVGLSITYAISLTNSLSSSVSSYVDAENAMTDLERIVEYSDLPSEAPKIIDSNRPPASWPEQGMVEFRNYSASYRDNLELTLRDVSFCVQPMQKVGIVGRTGAGKSSLTLALFRLLEAASGQILIDGQDIAQYGLFDVRNKLSIIPQDPVLFAGTVRDNVDPIGSYTDQQIWNALENAHLAEYIRSKNKGLDFEIEQSGNNLSVGQRQLICLARALLRRARILVLDEATAAIDNETDAIIQESIRKQFKNCTVLTIAHRLETVTDSDMILVVDGGMVAEYDTPENLLANESSLYFQLIQESKKQRE
ncbi:hypothetical protein GGI15_002181 [Coemansia interrupta]|uniref:Uncharacterized protein n=1 Tax=Coemansia interrupta TaxID=1126814 RepID=A0A9W8HGV1_9FUNG|nr:hypothetical protein GGI15_002181 [Coemansia interrupta]